MAGNGGLLRSSIPNQITVARLASVPLLMFFILWDSPVGRIIGVVLFFLAAISDAVDGYLARSFKQTSVFGKFADPLNSYTATGKNHTRSDCLQEVVFFQFSVDES